MKLKLCILTMAALLCPVVQAFAHHSFAAEYDEKKVITLKGVVTKFEWMNPHVRFYVDVKDAAGVVTNWDLELMSPNTLKRAGWDSKALKVGDEVVVTAYMAKDGSKRGNARGSVTLADGRKIFAGDARNGDNQ
jgi:Family of unknown function (DUF6152)